MALLDKLTADVAAETTVDASVETLLTQLSAEIKAISANSADPATVAALNGLTTQMETNAAALGAAVTANTPVVPPASPVVTGVSPNTGPVAGGTSVVISGTGFTGSTGVAFGTVQAASFSVVSDTTINAVTPAVTAGVADVLVTTPAGVSVASAADQITFS